MLPRLKGGGELADRTADITPECPYPGPECRDAENHARSALSEEPPLSDRRPQERDERERDFDRPSRRRKRQHEDGDELPRTSRKKRLTDDQPKGGFWSARWIFAAIVTGVGAVCLPFALLDHRALYGTFAAAVVLGLTGFVACCRIAARAGVYPAFQWTSDLGPKAGGAAVAMLGVVIKATLEFGAVGAIAGMFIGCLLVCAASWVDSIVRCARSKPKPFGPWFAFQGIAFVLVVLAFCTQSLSSTDRSRRQAPLPQPASRNFPATDPLAKNNKTQPPEEPTPPPKRTGELELDRALADLVSKNAPAQKKAADYLAGRVPDQHRPLVANIIAGQVLAAPVHALKPLLDALAVWATAEEVPTFIRLLSAKEIPTRNMVLQVIDKLRDKRTVQPVVNCLTELGTQWHGERTLIRMGALAEKEVLALLEQQNTWLRLIALRVLTEIGTQESISAIEAVGRAELSCQDMAKQAVAAIKKRTAK